METFLGPIRTRRAEWEARKEDVYDILQEGTKRAAAKADATLQEVRRAMRINYFEDKNLLK